jgi:hypothetical protein
MSDSTLSEVEDIIATWCLRYAALSNVDLAHLSNLSKRWRKAAHQAVIVQSSSPNIGERLLLLPAMVRYAMKCGGEVNDEMRIHDHASPSFPGSSHSHDSERNKFQERRYETFCAAWFDPDGIQELRISLSNNGIISTTDEDLSQNASSISPQVFGEPIYEISDNDDGNKDDTRSSRSSRKQQIRHPQRSTNVSKTNRSNGGASSSAIADDRIVTCYEWRGYKTAMDVLRHFDFKDSFVKDIFSSLHRNTDVSPTKTKGNHHPILSDETESRRSDVLMKQKDRETTYAVRGAVIARPESYCDCVDLDVERLRKIRFAAAGNDDDDFNNIRTQEYKQSLIRQEIRRRQLQRDVLPRIVARNFGGATSVKHRCIQFLNATGGHAVCMLTPPFACGPLVEPVTIFCVGIATEDGCFLSGLHHRFELGHLYPSNEIDEISEQSPVCISTECWSTYNHQHMIRQSHSGVCSNSYINDESIHTCEDDDVDRDGDEDTDDDNLYRNGDINDEADDDSYGNSSEEALLSRKCNCSFKGVGEKISALDEGKPRIIHRGHLGPGAWHCYVAVFDGENSFIRIDGVAEPMQTENLDADTPKSSAVLDGLTIGSDHCFGMSLCCGNGSGGEGEGAIAEFSVFQGRLDLDDIQAVEKKLMEKHGLAIPKYEPSSDSNNNSMSLWIENDFARQAHALFFLPETDYGTTNLPLSSRPLHIPLRFLAQHRSVAWKQTNPVTGEPIHVHRIGCKPGGASSSDF